MSDEHANPNEEVLVDKNFLKVLEKYGEESDQIQQEKELARIMANLPKRKTFRLSGVVPCTTMVAVDLPEQTTREQIEELLRDAAHDANWTVSITQFCGHCFGSFHYELLEEEENKDA